MSILYHLSLLSGPILACICGSFLTLIPFHNVMKYPSFWYENNICRLLAVGSVFTFQQLIRADYWSNFTFARKVPTYIFMNVLTYVLYFVISICYYFLWTHYFGFYQPMPLDHLIGGSIIAFVINAVLWLRYIYVNEYVLNVNIVL